MRNSKLIFSAATHIRMGSGTARKFLAATAILVTTVGAQAADLPRKAPVYKKAGAQVYDWTGFYAGVNFGGGVGRSRTYAGNGPASFSQNETFFLDPQGALGGGQIGYNWQIPSFYNLVFGVEADIQGSGLRGSSMTSPCIIGGPNSGSGCINLQQQSDWFGTVRGRVGYATGPVLSYVTAGYAYGNITTSGTISGNAPPVPNAFVGASSRSGFVVGTGVEASLGGNWTGKLEYLYVDLGTNDTISPLTGVNALGIGPTLGVQVQARENVFRGGVNYRFGGNSTYVEPTANWSGFYVGGNAGSIVARDPTNVTIGPFLPPLLTNITFQNAVTLSPNGYQGGAQAGYNWQSAAWVFGLEADIQGTSAKDDRTCIFTCVVNPLANSSDAFNQRLAYFGTVRGRIGYSVGATLFYGTGGFAYGQTKTTLTEAVFGFPTAVSTFTHDRSGYAVGAGIESPLQFLGLFGQGWTAKTEYLYVDLGQTTDRIISAGFTGPETITTRTQEHIFRSGINYHFNTPVVAKY